MRHEIVDKMYAISRNSPFNESQVQHLFALARKLLEQLPAAGRQKFALLKFYCDWTVHHKIDRSKEGAEILRRLHDIIIEHLKKKDNSTLVAELTGALSLDIARDQLNTLLIAIDDTTTEPVFPKAIWDQIVPITLEIVSNCTLSISPTWKGLKGILSYISARPIKGNSVVEELTIIKIPTTTFDPQATANSITYCLMLNTTDTTKIVSPFVKS